MIKAKYHKIEIAEREKIYNQTICKAQKYWKIYTLNHRKFEYNIVPNKQE